MKIKKSTLILIGSILASGSAFSEARLADSGDTLGAAEILKELVDAGYVKVDPKTGSLKVNASIFKILKDAGIADANGNTIMEADGGCSDTTGGGCNSSQP